MYGSIEQEIKSNDYGLNCSYRIAMSKGYFRFLGGVSYQEVSGMQTRLLLAGTPSSFPVPANRIGKLDVKDDGIGWRLGAAYEIPEIAFRTSLVYQSAIDYSFDGTVENLAPFTIPVVGEATVPQSVEFKVQSGIAPGWLAFGSIKWVDWSVLQNISFKNSGQLGPVPPRGVEITSLDLYYRDGWTVSGGIGHQINEKFSVAGSITWDRGTTQGLSSQTDTWTFGLGGSYKPSQNFEIRLAGALGILTSGRKDDTVIAGELNPSGFVADFGNDLVSAVSVSAKLKF
jgi:long-chain fatty acid transport protein